MIQSPFLRTCAKWWIFLWACIGRQLVESVLEPSVGRSCWSAGGSDCLRLWSVLVLGFVQLVRHCVAAWKWRKEKLAEEIDLRSHPTYPTLVVLCSWVKGQILSCQNLLKSKFIWAKMETNQTFIKNIKLNHSFGSEQFDELFCNSVTNLTYLLGNSLQRSYHNFNDWNVFWIGFSLSFLHSSAELLI